MLLLLLLPQSTLTLPLPWHCHTQKKLHFSTKRFWIFRFSRFSVFAFCFVVVFFCFYFTFHLCTTNIHLLLSLVRSMCVCESSVCVYVCVCGCTACICMHLHSVGAKSCTLCAHFMCVAKANRVPALFLLPFLASGYFKLGLQHRDDKPPHHPACPSPVLVPVPAPLYYSLPYSLV